MYEKGFCKVEIVTLATITFLGGNNPPITVRTGGTEEEHLRHAVGAANGKLERPYHISPNFRFEVREKDKEYAFVDDRVAVMTGHSKFECVIKIIYALEEGSKFFQLSKIYPIVAQ